MSLQGGGGGIRRGVHGNADYLCRAFNVHGNADYVCSVFLLASVQGWTGGMERGGRGVRDNVHGNVAYVCNVCLCASVQGRGGITSMAMRIMSVRLFLLLQCKSVQGGWEVE